MVDQLRIEFPSTKIFTIPTGWASVNLDQMNIDNELLDQISRFKYYVYPNCNFVVC